MKHRIDPTVDYVFKALLGAEENRDLLLDFLNALLAPPEPFADVEILNPFVPAQFDGDDYTVVDVKAQTASGLLFQVEIQLQVRPRLAARMVYTLADLYQAQLASGGDFTELRPVHAIWLLDENLLRGSDRWLHRFQLRDQPSGLLLSDHLTVHTVELRKWRLPELPLAPADRWVYFFREARHWDALPPALQTPEMHKAMAVLNRISEKTLDYWRYQARENFLREQRTIERMLEQERQEKELERSAKELERSAKEHAQAELEALRARMRALGLDPDGEPKP